MKEHKLKQLLEQEGKIIDDFGSGNLEMVERRFNAIVNFILNKEDKFLDGIKDEKLKRESSISKAKKDFIEGLKKAVELVEEDQIILNAFKSFEDLQKVEQSIMNSYPYELVESVSSYINSLDGKK